MTKRRSLRDLLGEPESVHDAGSEPESVQAPVADGESDWAKLREGVSVTWLSGALKRDPKTIKKRLGPCKPKTRKHGVDLYDLEDAMSYLVKPRFNIKEYLRSMNPQELPPMLKKEYWQAEKTRLDYQERAGELWPTASVLEVLAEACKRIKSQMQVWADDVERDGDLNPEQYKTLQARVDALRGELYQVLVQMPKDRKSGSALAEGPTDDDDDAT